MTSKFNFTQGYLSNYEVVNLGLLRLRKLQRDSVKAFWCGTGNPALLSEDMAKRLTEIETILGQLDRAIDTAQVQAAEDVATLEAQKAAQ